MKKPSKKVISVVGICFISLCLIVLCVWDIIPYRNRLEIGMTSEQFRKAIPEDKIVSWCWYYSFTDKDGVQVAVKFNPYGRGDMIVEEIKTFPKRQDPLTSQDFEQIKTGMTAEQVLDILGIPSRAPYSGIEGIDYIIDNGEIYCISFSSDDIVIGVSQRQ